MTRPTVNVYVDGFNLYNRAVSGTPYKWLDLEALSARLLKKYDINRIRYFTAIIKARPNNPGGPARQQAFIRALETNPKISVHYGSFLLSKPWMPVHPLTYDSKGNAVMARVRKMEEKGSDVNIASYMMFDAFRDDADAYVLLSNDSDLKETLTLLSIEMRRTVGIIFPVATPSVDLVNTNPSLIRKIRNGTLSASQLPNPVVDSKGRQIHKPAAW